MSIYQYDGIQSQIHVFSIYFNQMCYVVVVHYLSVSSTFLPTTSTTNDMSILSPSSMNSSGPTMFRNGSAIASNMHHIYNKYLDFIKCYLVLTCNKEYAGPDDL